MRLLDADTTKLEFFILSSMPKYAIPPIDGEKEKKVTFKELDDLQITRSITITSGLLEVLLSAREIRPMLTKYDIHRLTSFLNHDSETN
jgi:hypothetical protein